MEKDFNFVVIGGGIAGVSCAEMLSANCPEVNILLITASSLVKSAVSATQITKTLVELDIQEIKATEIAGRHSNLVVLTDIVTHLDAKEKVVYTLNHWKIHFQKLCICTGGRPNLIDESNPYIIGIRDTESVAEFAKRVISARKMIIVGNGGIATEIVYEIKGIEKVWVVKDDHISKAFVDPGAGEFLRSAMTGKNDESEPVVKRMKYVISETKAKSANDVNNPALGPDWHTHFDIIGRHNKSSVEVEFSATVERVTTGEGGWPIRVHLSNGKVHDGDFVVSATGVIPNSELFKKDNEDLKLAEDKGIIVDWKMESSLSDIFAAGDVCTAGWEVAKHWHQMRLWTQARQMGSYAGKCMIASLKNELVTPDFCFEIFSHVTRFFGFKVIMLGLYNGQKLGNEYEILLRVTKNLEYVKIIKQDGKMQGALLIGETDLEETCENLILNQLDLTPYGDDLLNPNIDIEDYFD